MSTIYGNGREYDITMKCDDNLKTTTTQYLVVGMIAGTTNSDWTVQLCCDTGTAAEPTAASHHAIGINQTYLSSGSEICDVRMFGLSKAVCAESITAGEFIRAYRGGITTTGIGRIAAVDDGASCTAYGQTITAHTVVLGRAMEDGSTNTVISIFLNPQLYDRNQVEEV